MDPLMRDLRDLDPSAPPAAVDLDRIITRGLRRRTATRVGAASGAMATALGLVTAAVLLQPAAGPGVLADGGQCRAVPTHTFALPSPSSPPDLSSPAPSRSPVTSSPTTPGAPSDATRATINRLNAALRPALATAFPNTTIVAAGTCDQDWTFTTTGDDGYLARLEVYDAAGRQSLAVHVRPGRQVTMHCDDDNSACVSETATAPTARSDSYDSGNGAVSRFGLSDLADGTIVNAAVTSYTVDGVFIVTRQGVSLTGEAAEQLALTPGLTLYP
jgi:hypothetical protein